MKRNIQSQDTTSKRRFSNALTHYHKITKRLKNFIVFDIESNDWKDFLIGGIYDGKNFSTYTDLNELTDTLIKHDGVIFSHFGGIFDHLFILDSAIKNGHDMGEIMMRGSSVFSFKINKAHFIDSSGIIPFSLDKAAKSYGVEHQKLEIDHKLKKIVSKKLIKYLEHDCKALFEVIEKFNESVSEINFKPTIASLAIEKIRKTLPKYTKINAINNPKTDEFIRRGYAGGRVEIFKPLYESNIPDLKYYDVNSLYPWAMAELNVPIAELRNTSEITPMSMNEVTVQVPESHIPILWTKQKQKFFFPTGTFRGVFTGLELLYAIDHGVKILAHHKGLLFEGGGQLFKPYVEELYHEKRYADDVIKRTKAKLFLNAGYGRLAIKRKREILVLDDGSEGITPIDVYIGEHRLAKKEQVYVGFSNAMIGAMITAIARIKLHKILKSVDQEALYYCDTDSIVTTEILKTGSELGQLKLEGVTDRACFLLPKGYIFGNDKKFKGLQKEFVQSLNFQDFKEGLQGDMGAFKSTVESKLSRIKSARHTDSVLKLTKSGFKNITKKYDKRKLFLENNEYKTCPLSFDEIIKMNQPTKRKGSKKC